MAGAQTTGLLPKNDQRPPFFAYAVSLYRADLLFRSLVDLTIAGLVIFAFTGVLGAAFAPVKSATQAVATRLQQPVGQVRGNAAQRLTDPENGPGHEIMLAIQAPQIPHVVIERATAASAAALTEARKALAQNQPQLALQALSSGDQDDPSILFGQAVATLRLAGSGRALEAQRLLRGATQKAFAPAFTLNGIVLFQLVAMDERGDLPAGERVSLDGAGRAVAVTAVQLASEAMQWWQRGAAFHDPEAMRLLGMGEARGFTGKRNLGAAVAYWRDAAARGDALARLELGHLYFYGTGVEADSEKALDLFRQASDQGILRASMALGTALVAKGIAGDVDAAREAMRVLDVVARKIPNAAERTYAHYVIGLFLSEVGHATVRDPARALDHFRFAARGGQGDAFAALARAYETGVGVEPDVARAFGYLTLLRTRDPAAAEREFTRLSSRLSPDERERAKAFSLSHDPVSPGFLNDYQVRQSPPGLPKGVTSNLRPSP